MRSGGGINQLSSMRIILHVYDLHEINDNLHSFGLGLYHSGVQIGGLEWTFAGGAGIYSNDPKGAAAKYRESFDMGEFNGTSREIDNILDELRPKFTSNSYHVLNQNCNNFAEDFVKKLIGKSIPPFINRLAYMGSLVQCLLPSSLTEQAAPVNNRGGVSSSGRHYGQRNTQAIKAPFSGLGARLGTKDELELRPMGVASAFSIEQQETARKARLSAFS